MLTFRTAGDRGDCIYQMPVMRAMGGGALLIEAAIYTRECLTPDKWCGLDQLLLRQPYVQEVRAWIPNERVHYNLNDMRAHMVKALRIGQGKDKHLAYWCCDAHGVPYTEFDRPWLTFEDPIEAARVVFARSGPDRERKFVYQNPAFPWWKVWSKYGSDAVFLGTEMEHEIFCATCGLVPHYKTPTLLEAARVIAGCELFVGNQSCLNAIAEGMKKNIVLEVWPEGPNSCPERPGVTLGWNQHVQLPDL